MMLHKAETPFIIKLKGYPIKDISKIFSTDTWFWRDNSLFNYSPSDIVRIKINYYPDQKKSFEIINHKSDKPELIALSSGEVPENVDLKSISRYLYYFSNINFQYSNNSVYKQVKTQSSFATIFIEDDRHTTTSLNLFKKIVTDNNQEPPVFDMNVCYGIINNEKEVIEIKYMNIDPILKELNDFLKK